MKQTWHPFQLTFEKGPAGIKMSGSFFAGQEPQHNFEEKTKGRLLAQLNYHSKYGIFSNELSTKSTGSTVRQNSIYVHG